MPEKKPIFGEIAVTTGGRDITRGFIPFDLLPPQDRILVARGVDYEIYEQVLSDDQVKATFEQRRLAVVSREWEVEPGAGDSASRLAAEFITEQLMRIGWDRVTEKMLYGVFYGFAVGECLWARDGARIVLDQIKVRKQRRFRFGADGRLKLLTVDKPLGEALPERKFWRFATGADNDDEPYGLGLAHWLYWPVFFKRNGIKFWLVFLEKLGMPTVKGHYPAGASEDDKKRLLGALAAIQTDSALIVPEGMLVELLETAKSSTPDYVTLVDKMDSAIAKAVVGQTMTTDDGSSLSQAKVHMDVRQDIVKADADLVSESFNRGPATWLTEWNFPGATPPIVKRRIEDDPDLESQANRDKTIHDMGFKPSLGYIRETYGGEWSEKEVSFPPSREPPRQPSRDGDPVAGAADDDAALAEEDEDAIGELARQAVADEGWERVMAPIVAPLRERLAEAETLEEFRAALAEAAKAMGDEKLIDLLAQALFAARLAGEAAAPVMEAQDRVER